jgi:hypothetical protein
MRAPECVYVKSSERLTPGAIDGCRLGHADVMSVNDTVIGGEHAARKSGRRHQGEGHLAVLDREVTMRG